ncbi:hypothetical protein [Nocardioides sp.]|uniref:hypothetical protein n=1 Tax=Nocardioides sp. TaxID=35761 RepID=UPI0035B34E03
MSHVTKVLLLLAFVVPLVAYVAGSLASTGGPDPADRGPVILRDAPTTPAVTRDPTPEDPPPDGRRERRDRERDDRQQEARVVTPLPTPVGEDDDDEWDDDGPDDDDTTDERDD